MLALPAENDTKLQVIAKAKMFCRCHKKKGGEITFNYFFLV